LIPTAGWYQRLFLYNGKSVGTVNCIIVKEPVYQIIGSSFNEIMIIIAIIGGVSFFASLIAGVIVYTRQKKVYRTMSYDTGLHFHEGRRQSPHTGIREAIPVKE
jgi:ABC-type dipeptide/oligopeptide/nickel transport system permease component